MKDIYSEPFLSSWPTPLSINDFKECFKSREGLRQKRKTSIVSLSEAIEGMGIFSFFRLGSSA